MMTPIDRFLAHVDQAGPGGCWLWTGFLDRQGYGRCADVYGDRRAHRAAHLLFIGPIPEGLDVDHICGVPACVNPDHLEAVTRKENLRRGRVRAGTAADGTHTGHRVVPVEALHCLDCHRTWLTQGTMD